MALSLKDPEIDSLARRVASLSGVTITQAVQTSLRERLSHELPRRGEGPELARALEATAKRCAALSGLDERTDGEIHCYGENGLPA